MNASREGLVTVIGRGHSGTSILSHTLLGSGVFLGQRLNFHGDTVPPRKMYEACRIVAEHVRWRGGLSWDFDALHRSSVDQAFERLVQEFLETVLASTAPHRGWKLPETTLAYPWLVRMFPTAKYIHIVRDPRDALLRSHITDDLSQWQVEYEPSDNELARRVSSWKYQHEIVKATPRPKHLISIRYEDLVLDQEATVQKLEAFLGFRLARIVMDETRVEQWKQDGQLLPHIGPLKEDMLALGYL